jgi:methyltransferase (TIGR00027 family)
VNEHRVNEHRVPEFQPSSTALTAAAARAAHLIVDRAPPIFADNLAARLLGTRAGELIGYHQASASHPILMAARTQVTCRSRFAEDTLAAAADRGVRQYVLLGAGLDSFCWRSALARKLRVFEVDHPRTQLWKRDALAAAGLDVPGLVSFVPADLGQDALAGALAAAGFDRSAPAIVSCLGVTMYLTPAALGRVLSFVAGCAPGTQLVADYMLPAELRDPAGDMYVELVAPAAAEGGEPWRTFLRPAEMSRLLTSHGSFDAEHVRQRDQVPPGAWERTDSLAPIDLSMIVRATVR